MSPLRLLLLAAVFTAATSTSPAEDEDNPSPVDLLMESISRDMKKLSRQFDHAASKDSSLELVDGMIKANTEAKSLEPESVGDRAGAEREAYLARYREGMDELGQCLSSLKTALETDHTGEAEALIDKAYALRKQYHDELL
jgi:soluble cytochrome b562